MLLFAMSLLIGSPADVGAAMFSEVEVEVGGQRIDRQTGQWMNVWSMLTQKNDTRLIAATNGSSGTLFQELSGMGGCVQTTGNVGGDNVDVAFKYSVPLQFADLAETLVLLYP